MPLPANWNTVTVTATFLKPDSTPATGNVQFTAVRAVGMDDTVVLPHPIVATLNVSGQISVELPCPDDAGAGFTTLVYEVKERTQYGRDAYFIELDNAMTSVELENIPKVDTVPPPDWYATLEGIAAEAAASAAVAQAYGPDMLDRVDVLEAGQTAGMLGYQTKALMDADLAHAAGTLALVTNDATAANNGTYRKTGASGTGSWVLSADRVTGLEARVTANEQIAEPQRYHAESGLLLESFQTNTPITVTNLTDAAAGSHAYTYGASGLTINLSTASRVFKYSTKNKVGGKKARITLTQVVNSGGNVGVGFAIGSKAYYYNYLGRVTEIGVGTLTTAGPTFAAPVTITTVIDIDDAGNMTATWSQAGGSVSVGRTDVAMGDFALLQIMGVAGASNVTHSAVFEAVGPLEKAAIDAAGTPELSAADSLNVKALAGLLAKLARAVPTGLTIPIPYDLQMFKVSGAREFFTNIDLRRPLTEGAIGVTSVYVDPVTGLDTNAGTQAAPFKSLVKGVQTAGDKLIVNCKPGLYDKDTCWASVSPTGAIVQVVPWGDGDVICSCHHAGLVWTGVGSNTYSATIVDCSTVADASMLTADGDYTVLNRLASLAAVQAAAGSYFVSGTTVYVHAGDNRAPDANIRVYRSFSTLSNGRATTAGQTLYMERIKFHGGNAAFGSRLASAATAGTILARDCDFKYASGDGFDINGHYLCVMQGCIAAHNTSDGFNYHEIFGSDGPDVIEVDCIGRWNGKNTEGTNNGTTLHDPTSVAVRVGGDYHHNQNRNVHDIGGSMSWNIGCTARDSQNAGESNFCSGLSGEPTPSKMWLDTCNSSGSTYDLEAVGGFIYTFDIVSGGVNLGTGVSAYTA